LGDAVHLAVKPENIHVFDKESGERVGEGA